MGMDVVLLMVEGLGDEVGEVYVMDGGDGVDVNAISFILLLSLMIYF